MHIPSRGGGEDAWITSLPIIFQDSDGEKSDDLVVDVSNEVSADSDVHFQRLVDMRRVEAVARRYNPLPGFSLQDPATPRASPAHSPPENGIDKPRPPKKDTPNSPASVASSGSTPSSKAKELSHVSRPELLGETN